MKWSFAARSQHFPLVEHRPSAADVELRLLEQTAGHTLIMAEAVTND